MDINLRKANAIQNAITETVNSIEIDTRIELNEFQDVAAELKKANDLLFANDARRQKLLLAFYNIRGLVGAANAQCGINTSLAKSAFVDKRISQLQEIAIAKPMTDLAVITGKIEKIRNRPEDNHANFYGRAEGVDTYVLSEEQIQEAKAEIKNLKKQKVKINDEILELNIKTEIPLSEDVVETLQAEGII